MGWVVLLVLIAVCGLTAWLVARICFEGPNLRALPAADGERFPSTPDSPAALAVQAAVRRLRETTAAVPLRQRIAATRAAWETLFAPQPPEIRFLPVATNGIRGEWVLAPGADPARRTLYIHGGAYAVGSAHSHRPLTTAFSRLTGGAVLALDYRLMPEHRRMAGIADVRAAYPWMLANGPGGPASARITFVAGDSAGGNLTLMLIAWLRDQRIAAPTAAVALSPQTDCTFAAPSWRTNTVTDPMLGPSYGPLMRLPHSAVLWLTWLQNRINPRNPAISPLFGDLRDLPPTLIQASTAEMLRDDSLRYAARARAAGSPITLQIWPGMVHVWQLFNPELPEANAALHAVGAFLAGVECPADTGTGSHPPPARQELGP